MAISVKFIKNATSAQILVTAGAGDTGKLQIQFNGSDIYNNLSGTLPDISGGVPGMVQPINIPLDTTGNIYKGVYYVNFVASAGSSDTSTVNFAIDPFIPCLESTYDSYTPNFFVKDNTGYTVLGGTVSTASRSLTLTYPSGSSVSPVLVTAANTTSNLYIDTNTLWTGTMQTTMSYDVLYNIAAISSYDAFQYQQVGTAYDAEVIETDSTLCDIYCCIEGLRKKVIAAQSKNRSYYAELVSEYSYVGALVTQYKEAVSCKKYEDLSRIYEQIKLVSSCDECDCGCSSEESKQVFGLSGFPFNPVVNNYAQAIVSQVRNSTGSTIGAGSVVYINGATGSLPTVTLAQANSEAASSKTYGIVMSNILNNSNGFVVVVGALSNVDTSTFADGAALWLSPSVPGGYTATRPVAPAHAVFLGFVTRSSNNGSIEVSIQNGYELNELHDVLITTLQDGDILSRDQATGVWRNGKTLDGNFSVSGSLTVDVAVNTPAVAATSVTTAGLQVNGNAAVTGTANITGGLSAASAVVGPITTTGITSTGNIGAPTINVNTGTFNAVNATTVSSTNAVFDSLRVDSTTLFVDPAADRVGFGTNVPTRSNDFASDVRLQNTVYDVANNAGADESFLTSTGAGVVWRTAADYAMVRSSTFADGRVTFISNASTRSISQTDIYVYGSIGNQAFSVGAGGSTSDGFRFRVAGVLGVVSNTSEIRFQPSSYLQNPGGSYYSFLPGAAVTGGLTGTFEIAAVNLGVRKSVFIFDPNLATPRTTFAGQVVASGFATNTASIWGFGRHLVGPLSPDGNYVEITINGTTYKLATVA
jgi:hypothetical protein